ncbi:MAG: family 16 glycoside hydrolase [Opitutales bacterium]
MPECSNFKHDEWNRYRIRVHGDRHQLWINNRFISDSRKKSGSEARVIRITSGESRSTSVSIRNARVRGL